MIKVFAKAFFIRALGLGLAFLLNIVIARVLGASGSGAVFLGITVIALGGMLGKFGLDNVIIKSLGGAQNNVWLAKAAGYFKASARLSIVASMSIVMAAWIVFYFWGQMVFLDDAVPLVMTIMIAGVVPYSVLWLIGAVMRASHKPGSAAFIESVVVPASAVLMILAVKQGGVASSESVAAIYVAALFLSMVVGMTMIRGVVMPYDQGDCPKAGELVRQGAGMAFIAVLGYLAVWLPSLFVGAMSRSDEIAVYNVGHRTALLLAFVLVVLNSIVAPRIAAMYKEGRLYEISALMRRSSLFMAVAGFPVFIAFVVFPEVVLSVFGSEFSSSSADVLRIVSIGQYVNIITGPVGYLFLMSGHESVVRNSYIMVVLLSAIACWFLIPEMSVYGAALICSAGLVLHNVVLLVAMKPHTGVSILGQR